eukprot:COSAG05_NODE_1699_length_4254_cov_3.541276_4_plen_89_part_00
MQLLHACGGGRAAAAARGREYRRAGYISDPSRILYSRSLDFSYGPGVTYTGYSAPPRYYKCTATHTQKTRQEGKNGDRFEHSYLPVDP